VEGGLAQHIDYFVSAVLPRVVLVAAGVAVGVLVTDRLDPLLPPLDRVVAWMAALLRRDR
jgi:hypothetical protein